MSSAAVVASPRRANKKSDSCLGIVQSCVRPRISSIIPTSDVGRRAMTQSVVRPRICSSIPGDCTSNVHPSGNRVSFLGTDIPKRFDTEVASNISALLRRLIIPPSSNVA